MRRKSFDMEQLVGVILAAGVLGSAGLLTAGLAWRGVQTGRPAIESTLMATNLFQFWENNFRHLLHGEIRASLLVNLGIALLMLTPYMRVLASTLYFAMAERNVKYTVITGFVLSILTYSLFLR